MRREAVGFPVSLDLEGRAALVVGGGPAALDKIERLLDAAAVVTVIARDPDPAIVALAERGRVQLLQRRFYPADARPADVVLVCAPDEADAVSAACEDSGAALWIEDDPARSHFSMPALARAGRVRLAITTSGAAPALASRIRKALERALDARFAAFVDRLAAERARLQKEEPDPERRREQLRALADTLEIELTLRYKT